MTLRLGGWAIAAIGASQLPAGKLGLGCGVSTATASAILVFSTIEGDELNTLGSPVTWFVPGARIPGHVPAGPGLHPAPERWRGEWRRRRRSAHGAVPAVVKIAAAVYISCGLTPVHCDTTAAHDTAAAAQCNHGQPLSAIMTGSMSGYTVLIVHSILMWHAPSATLPTSLPAFSSSTSLEGNLIISNLILYTIILALMLSYLSHNAMQCLLIVPLLLLLLLLKV